MSVGMIVRLQLNAKIPQFFLKLLSFLFECLHALLDFGVLVTVPFDRHEPPPRADEILASGGLDFKSAVMGAIVEPLNW